MSHPNHTVQSVGIAIGGLLSSAFAIGPHMRDIAIGFPTIESCAAFLRGSVDGTTFWRMHTNVSSGPFQAFPGPGSCALVVTPVLGPMRYGMVELLASQSAARTLTVISKI